MDEFFGNILSNERSDNVGVLSQRTIEELFSAPPNIEIPPSTKIFEELERNIKSQDLKQFIVKGVIKCRNGEDIKNVIEVFNLFFAASGNGNTHRFFVACGHDQPGWEHVHYWHDCNYLNNWCKCAIFKRFKGSEAPCIITSGATGRRYRKSIDSKEVRDPDSQYISNVLK